MSTLDVHDSLTRPFRVWYVIGGHRHYKGPQSNRTDLDNPTLVGDDALITPPPLAEKAEGTVQVV